MKLDIDSLVKSADDFSVKAEETGQMTLVTKSSALRKAAKIRIFNCKTLRTN